MNNADRIALREKAAHGVPYAYIPNELNVPGRPELGFFPMNTLFVKQKLTETGEVTNGVALYEPLLETFQIDKKGCFMEYHNIYGHGSWLIIKFNFGTESWHGEKFVDGKSVGSAIGKTWQMFFVHFTAMGLAEKEQCKFETK